MIAVYGRNILLERKGTIIICIVDGNILCEISEMFVGFFLYSFLENNIKNNVS
jgi:hypothetical protein